MTRLDLAIEQKILRELRTISILPQRVVMALSGGVDSMVMAEILSKWQVGLGLELSVSHIHHGVHPCPDQSRYRLQAQNFVKDWAVRHNLKFFTNLNLPKSELKGELVLRQHRLKLLKTWSEEWIADAVALAHHQDDLLETRMLRLTRGSGPQGLRSMSHLRGGKWRPLLGLSRAEIEAYAHYKKLTWIEDPSNQQSHMLRNWLRQEWLPALEQKRPGAMNALARSLESLAPLPKDFDLAPYVGLRRELLLNASGPVQRELLAQYLKGLVHGDYSHRHVQEIIKRLQSKRKNLEFEMLGLRFIVTVDFMWASRV